MAEVEYHPDAAAEYNAAIKIYLRYGYETASRFVREMTRAEQRIAEAPQRWPLHLHGTRRYRLRRHPFSLVYMEEQSRLWIIAIAHQRRRPGYWRTRVL